MESSAQGLISMSRDWLSREVFPIWSRQGVDSRNGSFVESLSLQGEPLAQPKRAMVQARQIYAFTEAVRMGILPTDQAMAIVRRASDFFVAHYSLPNGAFVHAVDADGRVVKEQPDLYGQAFALFGLAAAYGLIGEPRLKERALKLLAYLKSERQLKEGGYSEFSGEKTAWEANPHMHLFEAAIAWMQVDEDRAWRELGAELYELCTTRFIEEATGALCEHFGPDWRPLRENGAFVWEPGHHYEWAWLLIQYAEVCGQKVDAVPSQLYKKAEEFGTGGGYGFAVDEVWSNGQVKKRTARFWPQSERIKAAVALGTVAPKAEQAAYGRVADRALKHLFAYFEGVKPGLWVDTRTEDGGFVDQPVKASSLYHIICALSEYDRKRALVAG